MARAEFMTKEQAQEEFEADYEGNELFDGLPSDVYRDRFHVYLDDISKLTETENAVKEVTGVAKTKSAPEIAEGFTVIRNIAGAVAVILVVILLAVSCLLSPTPSSWPPSTGGRRSHHEDVRRHQRLCPLALRL